VIFLVHNLNNDNIRSVGIINSGNRMRIGNHWQESGARHAIDENLHRRCRHLSLISTILNEEIKSESNYNGLMDVILRYNGKVLGTNRQWIIE
jgi:hypothetical protein